MLRVFRESRLDLDDAPAHGFDSLRAQFLIVPFGKDKSRLPVPSAPQHDEDAAATYSAKCATWNLGVFWKTRQPEPQHVHRRRGLDGLDSRQTPDLRETAIGANRERSAHFRPAVLRDIAHASNDSLFGDEALHLGMHDQTELRIFRGLAGDELKETRLRNHENVGE